MFYQRYKELQCTGWKSFKKAATRFNPLKTLCIVLLMALPESVSSQVPINDRWPPSVTFQLNTAPQAFCQMNKLIGVYEFIAANLTPNPISVDKVDVSTTDGRTLNSFNREELLAMAVKLPLFNGFDDSTDVEIASNRQVLFYFWAELGECTERVPNLQHAVTVSGTYPDGAGFSHTFRDILFVQPAGPAVKVGPPVEGLWLLTNGLGKRSNHRRTIVPLGEYFIPQKFGFDLIKLDQNGRDFKEGGDLSNNQDFLSYGETVYSMTDGEIVALKDHVLENNGADSEKAVPFGYATAAGNYLLIKATEDTYFLYAHLSPGSHGLEIGDRVTRGQVIGRIGNSGNAAVPHLHVHAISKEANPNAAHGRAFHFDTFNLVAADFGFTPEQNAMLKNPGAERSNELPPPGAVIRFTLK